MVRIHYRLQLFYIMTFRQEKRIFYNWLSRRKLLDQYLFNKKTHPICNRFDDGYEFIFRGFHWLLTNEGHEFWLKMDMKWRKHLTRKRKKYQL